MEPVDIERKLEEAFDAFYGLQGEHRLLGEEAAVAKATYEREYAHALLTARDKGLAVEVAKAEAQVKAADSYQRMLVADAVHRANRSAIAVLTTQVDILRSLSASHRSVF
ncbi:MAG: hypothetical protein ACOYOQ_00310 [Microthrixaceae bacterium]